MDIQASALQPQASSQSPAHSSWVKWVLGLFVVLVIAGVSARLLFHSSDAFALQVPITSAVGAEFRVVLELTSPAYSVTAAETRFAYDTTLLELVSAVPGDLLPAVLVQPDIGPGYVNLTVGSGTMPKPGPGNLVVLTFRGLKSGSARIELTSSSQAAAQGYAGNVLPKIVPATIAIR